MTAPTGVDFIGIEFNKVKLWVNKGNRDALSHAFGQCSTKPLLNDENTWGGWSFFEDYIFS